MQVFFSEDTVIRIFEQDLLLDKVLGRSVHFRNYIHFTFVFNSKIGQQAVFQQLSGETGNANRVCQEIGLGG